LFLGEQNCLSAVYTEALPSEGATSEGDKFRGFEIQLDEADEQMPHEDMTKEEILALLSHKEEEEARATLENLMYVGKANGVPVRALRNDSTYTLHDVQALLETKLKVPWIMPNPSLPRDVLEAQFPLYKNASPLHVTVKRGEMLYLPAMWYHQVAQSDVTVAVNYWHDMKFDQVFLPSLPSFLFPSVLLPFRPPSLRPPSLHYPFVLLFSRSSVTSSVTSFRSFVRSLLRSFFPSFLPSQKWCFFNMAKKLSTMM
jgi:hypothetical protein